MQELGAVGKEGRFVDNIIYFCRALRKAGVPIGLSQIQDVISAVERVGFRNKGDFFTTLKTCLITRREHFDIFDQVFKLFWRDPEFLKKMMQTLMPMAQSMDQPQKPKPAAKRAAEAIMESGQANFEKGAEQQKDELILDAQLSFSHTERINSMDFEQMTNAEVIEAQKAITQLDFRLPPSWSHRYEVSASGVKIDPRATLHKARLNGGEILKLVKKRRKIRKRNLVLLCDISGSVSSYSRMMMHFAHALKINAGRDVKSSWANIHAFTFGTSLNNISHLTAEKDPDIALTTISNYVQDWDGGTKIASNLEQFNKKWSRRVLGSNAVVILMTDGLERDDISILESQMKRLKLSSGHLIWLNPLLRYDEFKPLAKGIQCILPHVDKIVPCHNINSLKNLVGAL